MHPLFTKKIGTPLIWWIILIEFENHLICISNVSTWTLSSRQYSSELHNFVYHLQIFCPGWLWKSANLHVQDGRYCTFNIYFGPIVTALAINFYLWMVETFIFAMKITQHLVVYWVWVSASFMWVTHSSASDPDGHVALPKQFTHALMHWLIDVT